SGSVTARCPAASSGLRGVTVDAFQVGSGDLIGSAVTDGAGAYTIPGLCWGGEYSITVVSPLGYVPASADQSADGCGGPVNFALGCLTPTGTPMSMGFWKHQVGVATGGNGNAQVDAATLCAYLDLIAVHFNN